MRSSKSRSRSKSNRNRSMGNVVNRVFDSSGPEGKVRGTPQQIIDKYNQLARDAQLSNDRVAFENFQQHAEHYTRMLGEAMREQEQFRVQTQGGGQGGQDRGGDNGHRDRSRDDQDDAPRYEEAREDRVREDRVREDRPREDRAREDRAPERRGPDDVIDTGAEEDAGLVETPENAAPAPVASPVEEQAAPRAPRRRRPRKDNASGEGGGDAKPEAAE